MARPMGVSRAVKHADQTTLYLTPMHATKDKLMGLIKAVAEQLPRADRWSVFLGYVISKITRPLPPWGVTNRLVAGI